MEHIQLLLGKYLKYLEFNKSASPLTLKSYKLDLEQILGPFKQQKSLKRVYKKISKPYLTRYLKQKILKDSLFKATWSAATKNRKIASLKSFLRWLYEQDYIDEDLNQKIKTPFVPSKIPHFLSLDEISSLIQSARLIKNSSSIDLTLIFLLYGGGLRVSEACFAQWKDLDFLESTLKIKGKGSKERLIVLPNKVMDHLKKIKRKKNDQYIFGSKPLNQKKAYNIIRNSGMRAGFKKPISPHVLRHSYATHLLDSGSDLRVLQDLLGHKSLSATQKYTQIQLSKLSRTLKKHPAFIKKDSS